LERTRVDAKQKVAATYEPVTRGITCTTYFTTCTSSADGATTLRTSMSAAMPTIGMVNTTTAAAVVQRSHLNLKKMSQTKKP
jgi:hypothetical protein